MASTGNIFPTSGTNVDRAGLTAWANPTLITADDGSDATCAAAGAGGDYLVASGFGFTIPDGAVIQGITFRVEASEHSPSTENCIAQLQDNSGSLVGSSKTQNVSGTTKTVYTYGGTSDSWGATLTPAIVNNANFGVRFWFETSHDVRVDFVTVAVEYDTTQTLTPTLFTNTNTFYSPSATPGAVALTPNLFTNSQTFYAPTVTAAGGGQTLTPSFFTNDQTFYEPTVSATYTLTPDLFTNGQIFYGPTTTGGGTAQTAQTGQTPAGRRRRFEVETRDGEIREFDNPYQAQAYLESLREPERPAEKPKRRRRRKKASDYAPQREVESVRFEGIDLRGFNVSDNEGFRVLLERLAMVENYAAAIRHMDILRDDEEMLLFM